jgi:nicotinamidase-related amidase
MGKCLYLVDVQNGFISEKTKYILPRLNNLLESNYFDFIISSKFINNFDSPFVKYLNWDKLINDNETALYGSIEKKSDLIVEKKIYSSVNEEVLKFLKNKNLDEIYIAGIDTDCCVLKTAVDFFELDIKPYVLEYYSSTNGGDKSQRAAITVLKRFIGEKLIIKNSLI